MEITVRYGNFHSFDIFSYFDGFPKQHQQRDSGSLWTSPGFLILIDLFIGFDVEIYKNLNSKEMNDLKRKFTEEDKHRDSCCFLLLIISHGTADNFIQCCEGTKTWNIECLVTEVRNFMFSI